VKQRSDEGRIYGLFAPGGYEDEHVTHYTLASLRALARRHGLEETDCAYVFRSELILGLRKQGVVEGPRAHVPRAEPVRRSAIASG